MLRKITFALLLVCVLSGYFITKATVDRQTKAKIDLDIRRLPSPQASRFLAAGYDNSVADIFWIEALNYFGWQLTYSGRNYQYLKSYIDIIQSLDPLFAGFYDWASTAYIYNGMPITRENVINSTHYANLGITSLHQFLRYDPNIILKAAFNYAIETKVRQYALPYFEMAARIFPAQRDMLIVASTYAKNVGNIDKSYELKLEYLGFMAFQAQEKQEIQYALSVLSSPRFNSEASNFVRALRIRMEKDDEIRNLVEGRLSKNPFQQSSMITTEALDLDYKVDNILSIDFKKTWIPADLHVLLTLN